LATFALVHGAWHGAWCWDRVINPLRDRGREVVAPELPSEDTEAGLEEYTDTIWGALDEAGAEPEDVVLVPEPGLSFSEQLSASTERVLLFEGGRMVDEEGRSYWGDEATTMRVMYGDLSPEDARWAFEQLESMVGASDRVVNPDWSRGAARRQLGVDPVELPSGHFPMVTHPGALADLLVELDRG
jgi:pimeloyl-ACP methyl ester carboxylesterase